MGSVPVSDHSYYLVGLPIYTVALTTFALALLFNVNWTVRLLREPLHAVHPKLAEKLTVPVIKFVAFILLIEAAYAVKAMLPYLAKLV